jgi:hypothetical protein
MQQEHWHLIPRGVKQELVAAVAEEIDVRLQVQVLAPV